MASIERWIGEVRAPRYSDRGPVTRDEIEGIYNTPLPPGFHTTPGTAPEHLALVHARLEFEATRPDLLEALREKHRDLLKIQ